LIALARAQRAVLASGANDPSSIYHRRPDLVAAAEASIALSLARAGVAEVAVPTATEQAKAEHDRVFNQPVPLGIQGVIDSQLAEAGKQSEAAQTAAAVALKTKLGPEYDRLMKDAALHLGSTPSLAAQGSEFVLRQYAALGHHRAQGTRK